MCIFYNEYSEFSLYFIFELQCGIHWKNFIVITNIPGVIHVHIFITDLCYTCLRFVHIYSKNCILVVILSFSILKEHADTCMHLQCFIQYSILVCNVIYEFEFYLTSTRQSLKY